MCAIYTHASDLLAHTLATSRKKPRCYVMSATADRIDTETAEKLIWALNILNEQPASCLTCGEEATARRKLIAAALTEDEIEKLAECDKRARVAERPSLPEFASEEAAGQLFANCVKLEKFTEALRELAQD